MQDMLGAIIGNILGSKYESQLNASKGLPQKPPRYTGDSVMTLAVAKWLLEDPRHTHSGLVHCMQKLGRGHLRAGYDEHLKEWIMTPDPKPYQGWDDKAALRVSPVGLYAATLDETRELARMVAEVTHNHPEGVRSAMAVAECVFLNRNRSAHNMPLPDVNLFVKPDEQSDACITSAMARKGRMKSKDFIRQRMTSKYGYTVSKTLEKLRRDQAPDCDGPEDITKAIYANYNSVQRAINVFLESESMEDCIRNAAAIGGNPTSIATIACSIFAANKEDWDSELMRKCERGLPHDLLNIIEEFEKLVFPTKPTLHSFKVTDNIYAGEYPRDRDEDTSVNKMRQFERFGISHFIDLTERGELASYKDFLFGMSHIRFPITDESVPESTDKVNNLLWQIDQILRVFPDMKIYIHCWGGVGRTGTIVGCLLAHQMGYDYDQTMAELRRLFKDCPKSAYRKIPETEEQCRFIARYIKNHC